MAEFCIVFRCPPDQWRRLTYLEREAFREVARALRRDR